MNPLSAAKQAVKRSVQDLVRGDGLREQTSASAKVALRQLLITYRSSVESGVAVPDLRNTGFRIFSQFDEDGVLLFLLAAGGLHTRRFVDLGAADGLTGSNVANLAFNLGFHGLGIDGNQHRINRAREVYGAHPDTAYYPPVFVTAFVTRSNIDAQVRQYGFEGEVDVLSIDIDGNDYWVWDALTAVRPRIVLVESRPELGREPRVVPYEEDLVWTRERGQYLGASPAAFVSLGKQKGYRLVGANRFGFNLFFLREDVAPAVPALGVEELFRYDRMEERLALFETIRDREFVRV